MRTDIARHRLLDDALWQTCGVAPTERSIGLESGPTVRIQDVGEGPPVLFIHGAIAGGSTWASLVPHLSGFRCLLLDRPGCGLSEPYPDSANDLATLERRADQLIADVLDGLGLDETAVVSTSFGGYFAFRGAAAHPERCTRIVELSWPFGAPFEKIPLSMRMAAVPGFDAMMERVPISRASVRMLLKQIGLKRAIESGTFTDEMLDWFVSLLRDTPTFRNDRRSTPPVIRPLRGLDERVLHDDSMLSRVTMPVAFIWGAEDPNGGAEIARDFVARFPDAELTLIDAAGHAPWIDEPELVGSHITDFLRR